MATEHPSGPVFSPLPVPSSSSPIQSSTPLQSPTQTFAPNAPRTDTTTLMFSFVIVFLGTLGGFMVGGAVWYRYKARRRTRENRRRDPCRCTVVLRSKPELWDVAISEAPESASVHRHSGWEDMHPLALALDNADSELFPCDSDSPPPMSSAERIFGAIGGFVFPSRNLCYLSDEVKTQRPSTAVSHPTAPRTQTAQIAVLIAMPAPRARYTPRAPGMVLPEPPPGLTIGTARVAYVDDSDSEVALPPSC